MNGEELTTYRLRLRLAVHEALLRQLLTAASIPPQWKATKESWMQQALASQKPSPHLHEAEAALTLQEWEEAVREVFSQLP